jgi:uncharacterized membrane-anchored protein YhcB (DUF1043 family)
MIFAINHVRARYTNNSLKQQPKFMKLLSHLKHHMSSVPEKVHFIWSTTSAVMKMTNTTSIENLEA